MVDQILPRLYLGDYHDAMLASPHSIDTIVTLHKAAPHIHTDIEHIHVPIQDEVFLAYSAWTELVWLLKQCMAPYEKERVLVHCRLGKSRSPSLVAAYMAATGWTPETAIAHIKRIRPVADPHPETWRSVLAWWERK